MGIEGCPSRASTADARDRSSCTTLVVLLLAALALTVGRVQAADAEAIAREVLSQPGYQTARPQRADDPADRDPPPERRSDSSDRAVGATRAVAGLLEVMAWGAGAIAAAFAVFALARGLRRARAKVQSPVDRSAREAAIAAPAPPAEAEQLAREGRYGEAVHALLLGLLEWWSATGHLAIGPSDTARELAEHSALADDARADLAHLVRIVERHLFAGLQPGRDDWAHAAQAAQRLRAACDGRAG